MKKMFTALAAIMTCGTAHALPVGNPSDASLLCDGLLWEGHCGAYYDPYVSWYDALSIRVGFYGDYVFNRHMKAIDSTTLFTNAGQIVINFWDRIDFFTLLGATNLALKADVSAFVNTSDNPNSRLILEADPHFSWSMGSRLTIWECGCTTFGIEAQYFSLRSNLNDAIIDSRTYYAPEKIKVHYHEWQVGLGVSHRVNLFVPYIAIKWSGSRMEEVVSFIEASFHQNNSRSWGYAVGTSIVDCEKISLTAEGRFGDEKALYVNGQIRF